jgi:hypothetical protein
MIVSIPKEVEQRWLKLLKNSGIQFNLFPLYR